MKTIIKTFFASSFTLLLYFASSTSAFAQDCYACGQLDRPDLLGDFNFDYNDTFGSVLVVEFSSCPVYPDFCYLEFSGIPSWLEIEALGNYGGERYRVKPKSVNTSPLPRIATVDLISGIGIETSLEIIQEGAP